MTAKEYLRDARRMKVAINGKYERMMQLRDIADKTTQTYSDMPRGGEEPQRMAKTIETIVDFERELAEETAAMAIKQMEVQDAINKMSRQEHRTVLELYYFNAYSWGEVADKMNYSLRNVHYHHSAALVEFEKHCTKLQLKT